MPCTVEYTFAAVSSNVYSYSDHFYVSDILPNFVHLSEVIHDVDTLSDHLPLRLALG